MRIPTELPRKISSAEMKNYRKSMENKVFGLLDLKHSIRDCQPSQNDSNLIDHSDLLDKSDLAKKQYGTSVQPKLLAIGGDSAEQGCSDDQNLHACLEDCVQVDHLFRSEPFENQPNTPQRLWGHIFRYLGNKKKPEDIRAHYDQCATMSESQKKLIGFGLIDNYMKILLGLDGPLNQCPTLHKDGQGVPLIS